jgi:hypothetical protein
MRTISGTRNKASALAVEVRIPEEGRAFAALAAHLTTGGVFVSTFHAVSRGAHVALEIALPGGEVRATGTVREIADVRASGDGGAGFRVTFDGLRTEDVARIEAFAGALARAI